MNDTISRQAAIDALDKRFDNVPMEQTAEILKLRKDLRELPSIQPKTNCSEIPNNWIPCSERLPDQYGNYLISIDREEPDIGTINPNDPRGWSLCDANGFYWASDKALNITAWMPLPEPYRGE